MISIKLKGIEDGTIADSATNDMVDTYRVLSSSLSWSSIDSKVSISNRNDRNDKLLEEYWNLYDSDEIASAVVDSISTMALGEHFEVVNAENDDVMKFWVDAFIRNWLNIWNLTTEALIFGNSFAFIIPNRAGEFYGLEPLWPLDVTKKTLGGKMIYTYKKKEYSTDQIFELEFFPRSNNIYGRSLFNPIKTAIDRKRTMDAAINIAVNRHFPRFHISLKPDPQGRYPSEDERRVIVNAFKTLATDQEFVTTNLIEIKELDTKGGVPDIEDYMNYFMNNVFMGVRMPPEITGAIQKSGTFATAKSRVNTFLSFVIPYYQRILEFSLKTQLMKNTPAFINILPPSSLALPYSK